MQYVIIPIEIGATGMITFTSPPNQCQDTENAVTPRTYTVCTTFSMQSTRKATTNFPQICISPQAANTADWILQFRLSKLREPVYFKTD